ncbi:hypothetical protein DHB64_04585 [Antarcticibacterium sp. W02-3]|nr:hypothetical protein [Antarcticibacterium sp. W02-3]
MYSCIPEKVRIISDKRISIEGKVLNTNLPIGGVPVVSFGVSGTYVNSHPSHILGYGRTSASGEFSFISLDSRNMKLSISVNPPYEELYNDNFATLHFLYPEGERPATIRLEEIDLPKKVNFTVRLENTSGTPEELTYTLDFRNPESTYLLEQSPENEEEAALNLRNFGSKGGTHNLSDGIKEEVLLTLEDSEIIFKYILGEREPQEISIPVTPQVNAYSFEY